MRTVIVSDREAVRDVSREAAEVSAHALADRLQSLEACGSRMGVPPLASRDQFDPLIASAHTISRMSSLYLRSRINCRAVRLHGQHASYHHSVTQCGFNAPLTRKVGVVVAIEAIKQAM